MKHDEVKIVAPPRKAAQFWECAVQAASEK